MKKVSIISIVALVVVIPLLFFAFSEKGKSSIPLAKGLSWNTTPKQAAQIFGEPLEERLDTQVTGKNIYVYRANILGREASITGFFMNDKTLTDIFFTWNQCDEDFFDQVYECIYLYYCKEKNFHVEESNTPQYDKYISMGINDGLAGVHYSIIQNGTTVIVNCATRS